MATPWRGGIHAFCTGQLGRTDEARATADELERRWKTGGVQGIGLVCAWVGAGETSRALDCLETACEEKDASLILLGTPWFDALRPEARFQEVLLKLGLPSGPSRLSTGA